MNSNSMTRCHTASSRPKRGKRPVILLVEDNLEDQELIRQALDEAGSAFELRIVSGGREAMDYLLHRGRFRLAENSPRPSLILLDHHMPEMDGKEVLRNLRSHFDLCSIPIVMLSSSTRGEDIIQSYRLGANSFVTKPRFASDFVQAVRELVGYWADVVSLIPA